MQYHQVAQGLFLPRAFQAKVQREKAKQRNGATYNLKRYITNMIQEHFPEHLFTVEVAPETGDIFIDHQLMGRSGARMYCSYQDFSATNGKKIIQLAGEVLERAGLNRSELRYYEDYDDVRVVEAAETQFKAK